MGTHSAIYIDDPTECQLKQLRSLVLSSPQTTFHTNADASVVHRISETINHHTTFQDFQLALSLSDNLFSTTPLPPEDILPSFFTSDSKKFFYISPQKESNRLPEESPRILLVYPGAIDPPIKGSRRRCLNLLYNLRKHNFSVDLIIHQTSKETNRTPLLNFLCSNIYTYKEKSIPKKSTTIIRLIEKSVSAALGRKYQISELFTERCSRNYSRELRDIIETILASHNYSHIVVCYAWMLSSMIGLNRQGARLICDMHDINFTRNSFYIHRTGRFLFNKNKQRRHEIALLSACDRIIAISESDQKNIAPHISPSRVILAPPGFDYACNIRPNLEMPIRQFRFGFIGSNMIANQMAIIHIMNFWWPRILEVEPTSRLTIAGDVSNNKEVRKLSSSFESINFLPLCLDISDYYSDIDISLNPVLIQGGINFKSIEAVFAGRILWTNRLGMACLGSDFPANCIEKEQDIFSAMKFARHIDVNVLDRQRKKAESMFSNSKSYASLFEYLETSINNKVSNQELVQSATQTVQDQK